MSASWKNSFNAKQSHIVERLNSARTVGSDGKVSLESAVYHESLVVLQTMINFSEITPDNEKGNIIFKALFQASKTGELTAQKLLNRIRRIEKEYLDQEPQRICLITTISLKYSSQFKNIRINNSFISFLPHLKGHFGSDREKIKDLAKHSILAEFPKDYAFVKIGVTARSASEAAEKALNDIDLVRAFWNYYCNRGRRSLLSSGKRRPLNPIVLGPLHSLHEPNGKLFTKTWWYEPQYQGSIKPYDTKSHTKSFYASLNNYRQLLKLCKYSSEVEAALLRYVGALDLTYWEGAFLNLWGVLEQLTDTKFKKYETTIQRASSILRNRDYHYLILLHLKECRNKAVHAGTENQEIEYLMHQLKYYVEVLVRFHLENGYKFKTLSEAAEFLDIIREEGSINNKIRLYKLAESFCKKNKLIEL